MGFGCWGRTEPNNPPPVPKVPKVAEACNFGFCDWPNEKPKGSACPAKEPNEDPPMIASAGAPNAAGEGFPTNPSCSPPPPPPPPTIRDCEAEPKNPVCCDCCDWSNKELGGAAFAEEALNKDPLAETGPLNADVPRNPPPKATDWGAEPNNPVCCDWPNENPAIPFEGGIAGPGFGGRAVPDIASEGRDAADLNLVENKELGAAFSSGEESNKDPLLAAGVLNAVSFDLNTVAVCGE